LCLENDVAVAAFRVILQRCSLAKLLRQIFTEYVIFAVLYMSTLFYCAFSCIMIYRKKS